MQTTVQFDIEKLEHLKRELARSAKSYIKVGVATGNNSRNRVYPPNSETVLKTNTEIAFDHEFGNPAAKGPYGGFIEIPQRSILLMPMQMAMGAELAKVKPSTYEQDIMFHGLEGVLDEIGSTAVSLVDKNFQKQGYPVGWKAISPITLAHRRKHKRMGRKLLNDSGQLRSSFDYEVVA